MKKSLFLKIIFSTMLGLIFGAGSYVIAILVKGTANLPFRAYLIGNEACRCGGKICPMCSIAESQFFIQGAILNTILFSLPWFILWYLTLNRKRKNAK